MALCAILLVPFVGLGSADGSPNAIVLRTVKIGDWGSLTVADAVFIKNNSTEPIDRVVLGFPARYLGHLSFYGAKAGDQKLGVRLLGNQSSNLFYFEVSFQAIPPGKEYSFTLYSVFDGVIRFQVNRFNYTFSAFPTINLKVAYYNGTVILPVDAKTGLPQPQEGGPSQIPVRLTRVGVNPAVNYVVRVPEYSVLQFHFNYTSLEQKILTVDSSRRTIDFNGDGTIRVTDWFRVTNGARQLDAIPLRLPKGAEDVRAFDAAGEIRSSFRTKGPTAVTNVTVMPRFREVRENQSFSFSVSYRLPERQYVQMIGWGRYALKFDLAPNLDGTLRALNVTILAPPGFRVEEIDRQPSRESLSAFGGRIEYSLGPVPQIEDTSFQITYRYSNFWAGLRPFGWVVLAEAALLGMALARRRSLTKEVEVPGVSMNILRQFVQLYDEKASLRLELERIESEAARGAMTKHDFRTRAKSIEVRLGEIDRDLRSAKGKLRADPRHGNVVRQLEKAEGEWEAARASEGQIRAQYRAGRLSKESYETIARDLRRRVERARAAMDSAIISLREEVQ